MTLRFISSLVFAFFFAASFGGSAFGQSLTLVDTANFGFTSNSFGDVGGSDCWGWESPAGEHYAIMGNETHTHFVRVRDMKVVDSVAGPEFYDGYYHRDIKTYRNYCYVVAEMRGTNEGIQIIDLSYLPDSVHYVGAYSITNQVRSHNFSIDTARAFMYVVAQNYQGVRMISLANPEVLVDSGFLFRGEAHDVFARNDTLWVAEGNDKAFSVWDVSDKSNPQIITRVNDILFGYAHNIWPTDDGKFFVTTEETSFKTVKIWDMTDPNNVVQAGQWLAPCSLAHNVHVEGDFVFTSHYESGVIVTNIANPYQPFTVASFDTYPQGESPGFFGCWGVFPHTDTSLVYASNFEGKLTVLNWDANGVGVQPVAEVQGVLGAVYPNPVGRGDVLRVPVSMDRGGALRVEVLNVLGERVAVLWDGVVGGGDAWVLEWDVEGVGAGVYLVRGVFGDSLGVLRRVVVE